MLEYGACFQYAHVQQSAKTSNDKINGGEMQLLTI